MHSEAVRRNCLLRKAVIKINTRQGSYTQNHKHLQQKECRTESTFGWCHLSVLFGGHHLNSPSHPVVTAGFDYITADPPKRVKEDSEYNFLLQGFYS